MINPVHITSSPPAQGEVLVPQNAPILTVVGNEASYRPESDTADGSGAPNQPLVPTTFIHPQEALCVLKLKCPAVRRVADNVVESPTSGFIVGMAELLSTFEGGPEIVHRAFSGVAGVTADQLDAAFETGRQPGQAPYTCAQVKGHGCTSCPSGGCVLPDGKTAEAPIELLAWNCNIKEVGQMVLAQSVSSSEFGNRLVSLRDKILMPDHGVLAETPARQFKQKILRHLGAKATMKQTKDVAEMVTTNYTQHMLYIKPSPELICFTNGTLNVITRTLGQHSPVTTQLNRIPHPYRPEAQCPMFLQFLDQTFTGNIDKAEKIALLQQWFGYILTADTRFQQMLMLYGDGANGKSVLESLMRLMLGSENVTSASLERFNMPYVRAELEGKLLNISADLPQSRRSDGNEIKAIVCGEFIEVSPKMKPSYSIEPYARLVVAANHLPASRDSSGGHFRRLLILNFTNIVPVGQRDPQLFQKLAQEIEGIISWAVTGLYDLREQAQFTIPLSSDAVIQSYQKDISPLREFAAECLTRGGERSFIQSKDLYLAFRLWCRDRGLDCGNVNTMGKEMRSLGFKWIKRSSIFWYVESNGVGQDYFRPATTLDDIEPGELEEGIGDPEADPNPSTAVSDDEPEAAT
jgi:putative DNA primase/helicase